MAGLIYGLCTATAFGCAVLLLRGYFRIKSKLLLWSGLCFVGLGISNFTLTIERLIFTESDMFSLRLIPVLIGLVLLIYGLIWERE